VARGWSTADIRVGRQSMLLSESVVSRVMSGTQTAVEARPVGGRLRADAEAPLGSLPFFVSRPFRIYSERTLESGPRQ
jgi:hypothetical protein